MNENDPTGAERTGIPEAASLRRRQPRPGDLTAEIRTLLAAAGLPCAEPDSDRVRAVGFTVACDGDGNATLEWFVSRSLRTAASDEQIRGVPFGHSVVLHGEARRHIHAAAFGLLESLGYGCSWTADQLVRVAADRRAEPTALAADVSRIVAELGTARLLPPEGENDTGQDPTHPPGPGPS